MDWINLSSWVVTLGGILNEPIDAVGNLVNCSNPHLVELGKCALNFGVEVGSNLLKHLPYIGV